MVPQFLIRAEVLLNKGKNAVAAAAKISVMRDCCSAAAPSFSVKMQHNFPRPIYCRLVAIYDVVLLLGQQC